MLKREHENDGASTVRQKIKGVKSVLQKEKSFRKALKNKHSLDTDDEERKMEKKMSSTKGNSRIKIQKVEKHRVHAKFSHRRMHEGDG